MSQEYDIMIQLRRGTEQHWTQKGDLIPYYGEYIGVFETAKDPSGNVILVDDPKVPGTKIAQSGKFLYALQGDGYRTVTQLRTDTRLYPIAQATLDPALANKVGACRDFDEITKTNATTTYASPNDMLHALHYPYGTPRFLTFNPASYAVREVGTSYNPNVNYSWTSENPLNVKNGSVVLTLEHGGGLPVTLGSGLNGTSPVGGLAVTGKGTVVGGAIGQQTRFTLSGLTTREQQMATLTRTLLWEGARAWFVHPNNEYLVSGMNAKPGEPEGAYVTSDATVGGYINTALDGIAYANNGPNTALGDGIFNDVVIPAGNGSRLYAFYPEAYRATMRILDYTTKSDYPVLSRKLTITRNGVQLTGYLFGMNLLVVGNTLKVTLL